MAETRKILLVAGHGAGDPGAVGNGYTESVETRRITSALLRLLDGKVPVTLYPQTRNLVRTSDHSQYKGFNVFEFHLNASNRTANGAEILIRSGLTPNAIDKGLMASLAKRFNNRGFKYRSDLGNMNRFHSLGGTGYRLIEVCFIDNKNDIEIYESNFNAIVNDLANIILSEYGKSISSGGSTPTPPRPTTPSTPSGFYTGGSIVEYLNSIGVDSSMANRRKLASQHGIANYTGTANQNTQLLNILRSGSKPNTPTPSKPAPAPSRPTYTGSSIVEYLNIIGQDSSMTNRKRLATQHGIRNYTGTASQNTTLLNKLRGGSAPVPPKPTPAPARKSNETIAREVIAGKWGNGSTRKTNLQKAGYNYNAIQALVNKLV